jgi:hypothetical protein
MARGKPESQKERDRKKKKHRQTGKGGPKDTGTRKGKQQVGGQGDATDTERKKKKQRTAGQGDTKDKDTRGETRGAGRGVAHTDNYSDDDDGDGDLFGDNAPLSSEEAKNARLEEFKQYAIGELSGTLLEDDDFFDEAGDFIQGFEQGETEGAAQASHSPRPSTAQASHSPRPSTAQASHSPRPLVATTMEEERVVGGKRSAIGGLDSARPTFWGQTNAQLTRIDLEKAIDMIWLLRDNLLTVKSTLSNLCDPGRESARRRYNGEDGERMKEFVSEVVVLLNFLKFTFYSEDGMTSNLRRLAHQKIFVQEQTEDIESRLYEEGERESAAADGDAKGKRSTPLGSVKNERMTVLFFTRIYYIYMKHLEDVFNTPGNQLDDKNFAEEAIVGQLSGIDDGNGTDPWTRRLVVPVDIGSIAFVSACKFRMDMVRLIMVFHNVVSSRGKRAGTVQVTDFEEIDRLIRVSTSRCGALVKIAHWVGSATSATTHDDEVVKPMIRKSNYFQSDEAFDDMKKMVENWEGGDDDDDGGGQDRPSGDTVRFYLHGIITKLLFRWNTVVQGLDSIGDPTKLKTRVVGLMMMYNNTLDANNRWDRNYLFMLWNTVVGVWDNCLELIRGAVNERRKFNPPDDSARDTPAKVVMDSVHRMITALQQVVAIMRTAQFDGSAKKLVDSATASINKILRRDVFMNNVQDIKEALMSVGVCVHRILAPPEDKKGRRVLKSHVPQQVENNVPEIARYLAVAASEMSVVVAARALHKDPLNGERVAVIEHGNGFNGRRRFDVLIDPASPLESDLSTVQLSGVATFDPEIMLDKDVSHCKNFSSKDIGSNPLVITTMSTRQEDDRDGGSVFKFGELWVSKFQERHLRMVEGRENKIPMENTEVEDTHGGRVGDPMEDDNKGDDDDFELVPEDLGGDDDDILVLDQSPEIDLNVVDDDQDDLTSASTRNQGGGGGSNGGDDDDDGDGYDFTDTAVDLGGDDDDGYDFTDTAMDLGGEEGADEDDDGYDFTDTAMDLGGDDD